MFRLTLLGVLLAASLVGCRSQPGVPPPSSTPEDGPLQVISTERVRELTPTAGTVPTGTPAVGLPGSIVPQGLGVNIHFLTGHPLELDAIAKAGLRIVRTDVPWADMETTKGVYDFSVTDAFVTETRLRNIRVLFLLNSGNPLYDNGLSPHTDEGRAALVGFAATMAVRYAGRGILWDLWGEPNGSWSWKPKPNVQDYAKLALETMHAMRQADPNVIILGPGICCFEDPASWQFYDQLGQLGVLTAFDAVSIHDYYDPFLKPEEVPSLYTRLRGILDKYSPEKRIPIVEDEFGYSTTWLDLGEMRQAQYLARLWLINLANDVDMSIWYDWKNDGSDPKNPEHNFGIDDISAQPNPDSLVAQTLTHALEGYHFERRVPASNNDDYMLLFRKGDQSILVIWTIGSVHTVSLALSASGLEVISMVGEHSKLIPTHGALAIRVNGSPAYLLLGTQSAP